MRLMQEVRDNGGSVRCLRAAVTLSANVASHDNNVMVRPHQRLTRHRMFSSMHVSGEQLGLLSGVAAILRFPLPELDEPHD